MMKLIAHRGESYLAPENTLPAIELAWTNKIPAVEFDVRLTRDGRLVVCHDADTLRISGQNMVIREHDLRDLAQLDVGRWKGEEWAGVRLPTLEQALATVPANGRVFIEIKDDSQSIPPLVSALGAIDRSQCTIIAFNADVVAAAKKALPDVEVCWLVAQRRDPQSGQWIPNTGQLIAGARAAGADGLDLSAGRSTGPDGLISNATSAVDAPLVRALHDAGLKVYVWTVDDPAQAKLLLDAGVDGLTTNRPAWIARQLGIR